MLRLLVAILIRQADASVAAATATTAAEWLAALQSTKWGAVNRQNGQISGTMVNGKSVTISAVSAFSLADILMASELALQIVEQGLTGPMGRTQARLN